MTSPSQHRVAKLIGLALLFGGATRALARAPEWRVFWAGSDVTRMAAPTESGGALFVDAAALAPTLGIEVRVERTDAVVRDAHGREWRGAAGGLSLAGPGGEVPLVRPLRIENRSVYLPVTTLADLADLSLVVDPTARTAHLDRLAAAGEGLPDDWQAVSFPKSSVRRDSEFEADAGFVGALPSVLPPAHDTLRLGVGVEHQLGADWRTELTGSGSLYGIETRLAVRATAGQPGAGVYSGIVGLYQPEGFGLEAGDLFSGIWGLARGVRFLGRGTGADPRGRLAFSLYLPSVNGGNAKTVLAGSDEVPLGQRTTLGGEVASNGAWLLQTHYRGEGFGLFAYGRQAVGVGAAAGLAGAVELPANLGLQASWNRTVSGSQVATWNDVSLLVPLRRGANLTVESSHLDGETTRLRTDTLVFALPLGPLLLRTTWLRRDGEVRLANGRSAYGQRDLLSTLAYDLNRHLRFDLLAVDRRPDGGPAERWQQLTGTWRLRAGTQLQVIATTSGSPYHDPLHLRLDQVLPRGYSIFAEYGQAFSSQVRGHVVVVKQVAQLKLLVRKTFDVPTPAGGGEVLGTVASVLGPVAEGVPVELGPYRTATDPLGRFAFRNVAPGSYNLAVIPQGVPANFVAGTAQTLAVAARGRHEVELPLTPLGVVAGEVYLDRNGNDRKDAEEGLAGVVLRLDDLATESTPDGTFAFHNVLPGSHRLRVDADRLPHGVALTIPSSLDLGMPAGQDLAGVQFRLVEKKRPLIYQELGKRP
ncbi:MAG TPA: hypothetical protein VFE33_01355 [Thermoanaerobaculia bacterium]|nr:hypothetical protein [Thermoanaerobaculia bacterium]